jgi:hypothetical protein
MSKFLSVACAGVAALGLTAGAIAANQKTRVHGTISSVNGRSLTIDSLNGKSTKLTIGSETKYASVVPSKLSDIKSGDFVGIGATGPDSKLAAMEVVVFPDSMRGTGEGHYAWSVPASIASADRNGSVQHETGTGEASGAPPIKGTMTNGTVEGTSRGANAAPPVHGTMTNGTVTGKNSAEGGAPPVQGTMTNGTVASKNAQNSGGEDVTVSYNNGQRVQIHVPPNTPVVRFVAADKSILKPGAKVFAVASGSGDKLDAGFVAVGKNGLTPPM